MGTHSTLAEREPGAASDLQETERGTGNGKNRWRTAAAAAVAAVVVAAVAVAAEAGRDKRSPRDQSGPAAASSTPGPAERKEPAYTPRAEAPGIKLRLAGRDVELRPWSYCWANGCADGWAGDPERLTDVGSPESVDLWFGPEDWDLGAGLSQLGTDCPRRFTGKVVRTGAHTFRVEPGGPAGRYQVDLFARGSGGGVAVSFVWETPHDGPVDQPAGGMALVASNDGKLTSYGLGLAVSNLGFHPAQASATVTATAANGRSLTLPAKADVSVGPGCADHGSVQFVAPDVEAREVTALGPPPFTYRVELVLDGKEYVGTATWPDDEVEDNEPNVSLTFDPPLPGYDP